MAVMSKADIMTAIKDILGERNDDTAITFLENISDTFDDLEKKTVVPKDFEEYKVKYEDMRKKYMDRFFSNDSSIPADPPMPDEEIESENAPKSYDDLFIGKDE